MTNYEKIKAMSIEEMAEFLDGVINDCSFCPCYETCPLTYNCKRRLAKWLESEAEDNG